MISEPKAKIKFIFLGGSSVGEKSYPNYVAQAYWTQYEKIVVALGETIRLMKQIDEVITAHGSWPLKK